MEDYFDQVFDQGEGMDSKKITVNYLKSRFSKPELGPNYVQEPDSNMSNEETFNPSVVSNQENQKPLSQNL